MLSSCRVAASTYALRGGGENESEGESSHGTVHYTKNIGSMCPLYKEHPPPPPFIRIYTHN